MCWVAEVELGGRERYRPGYLKLLSATIPGYLFMDSGRLTFLSKMIFSKNIGFSLSKFEIQLF